MFNKKDQIRMFMFQSVYGFATSNPVITNLIKAFAISIDQIGVIINSLLELGSQPSSIIGSGAEKEKFRRALDQLSYSVIKAARGYFVNAGNADMAAKLKMSQSKIIKIQDTNIVSVAQSWLKLIQPFVANMADWNITSETLTQWQSAIDDYSRVLLTPKNQLEARRQRNQKIKALIEQGMSYCTNELDSAAIGYKTNGNIDFFNQYTQRRQLTAKATRHGKFRVLILDDLMQPVPNVTLTQNNTQNQATTDMGGLASMDIKYNKTQNKAMADIYSFTLTSGTQNLNTGLIEIKHNQTVTRTYFLEPSGFIVPAYEPAIVKASETA